MSRELVASVQNGAGSWSSARWGAGGELIEHFGVGLAPCDHKFRAAKDCRGYWDGVARCVYCGKRTSWKTREVNRAIWRAQQPKKRPYVAPTVRDVERKDLPKVTTPRALRELESMFDEAELEDAVEREFEKITGFGDG